ncbi:hypothetical protein BMS3Abin10_00364 [bacterium BMS3Abin10]|nr:hypothetical protein BMS3Abin10_00364 [bacterium BMS3Abin10]GBE39926.1 hypothetical protein BMS3Bbin08_02560 [bacterium BMS3Bbin08]
MVGMQNELVKIHSSAAHNLMTYPMGFMTYDKGNFQYSVKELKKFGIKKSYLTF